MEQNKNFERLSNQFFGLGYPRTFDDDLKKALAEGNSKFTLSTETPYGKDRLVCKPNLSKGKDDEMYYLNSIDRTYFPGNDPSVSITHRFPYIPPRYVKDGDKVAAKVNQAITRKEAYNLFKERSVLKYTSDHRKEWVVASIATIGKDDADNKEATKVLTFKTYPEFNHREMIGMYPLTDLRNQETASIFYDSLERGNLQKSALELDGKITEVYVAMTAKYKSLDFFDKGLKRMYKEDLEQFLGAGFPMSPQRNKNYSEGQGNYQAKPEQENKPGANLPEGSRQQEQSAKSELKSSSTSISETGKKKDEGKAEKIAVAKPRARKGKKL